MKKLALLLMLSSTLYGVELKQLKERCDQKDQKSCYTLGIHYLDGTGVKKDRKKAQQLFQKGCKLKNYRACQMAQSLK